VGAQSAYDLGIVPHGTVSNDRPVWIAIKIQYRSKIHIAAHCPNFCAGDIGDGPDIISIVMLSQIEGRRKPCHFLQNKSVDPSALLIDADKQAYRRICLEGELLHRICQLAYLFSILDISGIEQYASKVTALDHSADASSQLGIRNPGHEPLSDSLFSAHLP